MVESKIDIEVNLKTEDVYNFQKALFYKQLSPGILITIGAILLLWAVSSIIEKPPFGSIPILTIALIAYPMFFLVIVPLALKKGAINVFKTNKLLQKTQRYQVGIEGLEVSSESGQGFVKWNEFYKAIESKDSFMFFISKRQAYIVPKRCFEQNTHKMELLRSYMKSVPTPKDDKVFGIFKKGLKFGCLLYILLFLVVLTILALSSSK